MCVGHVEENIGNGLVVLWGHYSRGINSFNSSTVSTAVGAVVVIVAVAVIGNMLAKIARLGRWKEIVAGGQGNGGVVGSSWRRA